MWRRCWHGPKRRLSLMDREESLRTLGPTKITKSNAIRFTFVFGLLAWCVFDLLVCIWIFIVYIYIHIFRNINICLLLLLHPFLSVFVGLFIHSFIHSFVPSFGRWFFLSVFLAFFLAFFLSFFLSVFSSFCLPFFRSFFFFIPVFVFMMCFSAMFGLFFSVWDFFKSSVYFFASNQILYVCFYDCFFFGPFFWLLKSADCFPNLPFLRYKWWEHPDQTLGAIWSVGAHHHLLIIVEGTSTPSAKFSYMQKGMPDLLSFELAPGIQK